MHVFSLLSEAEIQQSQFYPLFPKANPIFCLQDRLMPVQVHLN